MELSVLKYLVDVLNEAENTKTDPVELLTASIGISMFLLYFLNPSDFQVNMAKIKDVSEHLGNNFNKVVANYIIQSFC